MLDGTYVKHRAAGPVGEIAEHAIPIRSSGFDQLNGGALVSGLIVQRPSARGNEGGGDVDIQTVQREVGIVALELARRRGEVGSGENDELGHGVDDGAGLRVESMSVTRGGGFKHLPRGRAGGHPGSMRSWRVNGWRRVACLGWAVVVLGWGGARAGEPIGAAANYAFETGAFMKETVHAEYRTPPTNWTVRSGAIALNAVWETNRQSRWYIEYQKVGWDHVAAGLAFGDTATVSWGLKVLEWGLAQMTPDGEFRHPDNYHSASFLVEATAHAVLALEASPMRGEFAARLEALKPRLHAAARWMILYLRFQV